MLNVVNEIASSNLKGDNTISDNFHKIPQDDILMPFVQNIED